MAGAVAVLSAGRGCRRSGSWFSSRDSAVIEVRSDAQGLVGTQSRDDAGL